MYVTFAFSLGNLRITHGDYPTWYKGGEELTFLVPSQQYLLDFS